MPLYEYECEGCGKITEALRSIAQADRPIECEHCHRPKTHRIHSVFATGGDSESLSDVPPCGRCGDPAGSCGLN